MSNVGLATIVSPIATSQQRDFSSTSKVDHVKHMISRSHYTNQVASVTPGDVISLNGFVQSLRTIGKIVFIVLRDVYGTVQLRCELGKDAKIDDVINRLTIEGSISAKGKLALRPEEMVNKSMDTGKYEILVDELVFLNSAPLLPFDIRSEKLSNEELRLKYRFLDLRRTNLTQNLIRRSKVTKIVRDYLLSQYFHEIETPTLFKPTPESGAKEFLVPTRNKTKFYSLVQSPQQFKQILMSGGLDRYFQIARCYRDEGMRFDRQPEFTQIDLEMSFIRQEDIQNVIEGMLKRIWKEILDIDLPTPFPRMKFETAMTKYGIDKPDTRFDMQIQDISDIFPSLSQNGDRVNCLHVQNLGHFSNAEKNTMLEEAKRSGKSQGVFSVFVKGDKWSSSLKYSPEQQQQLIAKFNLKEGDLLVVSAGPHMANCKTLGRLRNHFGGMLISENKLDVAGKYNFLWVVDFPLFSIEDDQLCATHHPFTAPVDEDYDLLMKAQTLDELLAIRGQHYDVVLNGVEIGGGSIRIHESEKQAKVFQKLNFNQNTIDNFSHLLEALKYGCPPHGGLAIGLDRLVALTCGAPTLRDVIAFPKTGTGADLMAQAPAVLPPGTIQEFGLEYIPEKSS